MSFFENLRTWYKNLEQAGIAIDEGPYGHLEARVRHLENIVFSQQNAAIQGLDGEIALRKGTIDGS